MIKLLFTIILGFITLFINAQTITSDLISSSGDYFAGSSFQIAWSIGELQTKTLQNSENTITQGFHQGTYTITSIYENTDLEFSVTAFPNPTIDLISVNLTNYSNRKNLTGIVTNLAGKILQNIEIKSDSEQINFSNYPSGTYVISIFQNFKLIKSFQIIKI